MDPYKGMIAAIRESMFNDADLDEFVMEVIRDIFAVTTDDEILHIYIGYGDSVELNDKLSNIFSKKGNLYPIDKASKIYEIVNKYKKNPRDPFTRNPAVPDRYDIDLNTYEEVNYEKGMDVGFGTFIRVNDGSIARVLNDESIYFIYGTDGIPKPSLTYNPLKYGSKASVFIKKVEGGYRMKRKSRRHLRKRVRKTKTTRRRN